MQSDYSHGSRATLDRFGRVNTQLVGPGLLHDSTAPARVKFASSNECVIEYHNEYPTNYGTVEPRSPCPSPGLLSPRSSGTRNASIFDIITQNNLHPDLVSKKLSTRRKSSRLKLNKFPGRKNSLDYSSDNGSVFKQIREVNRESKGEYEFLTKSLRVLRNTALTTILMMTVLIFPIGMVLLGVKYLHGCPKEPYLPIYLLVGGCFWMLKMFTVLWRQMKERNSTDSIETIDGENKSDFITDRSSQFTDTVLSLFLLVWFGFGNFWTWRIYKPTFSMQLHEPTDWCEETLYTFCVIQILSCCAAFVVFLMTIGCLFCARHICCIDDRPVPTPGNLYHTEKRLYGIDT